MGESVLVVPESACPDSVAAAACDAEAPDVAVEPAPDEDVAELDDEADGDDVLPEFGDAEELDEADEPSLAWPCVCAVSVTVVVLVTVVDEEEPALRTGAPAKIPTTIEMQKTATIAAAMLIGLRYFLMCTIRAVIEDARVFVFAGSSDFSLIT